jgi:hypothetical protein
VWRPWKTACEVLSGEIGRISPQEAIAALDRLRVHA